MIKEYMKHTFINNKMRGIFTLLGIGAMLVLLGTRYVRKQQEIARVEELRKLREDVARAVSDKIQAREELEETISQKIEVDYTIDEKLEGFIKNLLKRYRSDYSSVVVIDNNTGKILSAVGYQRDHNKFDYYQPFSTTNPSASLFKIITSAALLEKEDIDPETKFTFRGKGTTLYKYQLRDKESKWNRRQTLSNAFAFSNNVVFGKAAIENVNSYSLYHMAEQFGFNEEILDEVLFSKSKIKMPENQYELAELASGFNKKTLISPVHAAVLASIVARDGEFIKPTLLEKVMYKGKDIWSEAGEVKRVITEKTAIALKEMMSLTVKKGTARGSFRSFPRKLKEDLIIGGKTGSITGGIPFGKRDWFTAFAIPREESAEDKGISVCVMNVNVERWYVRSSYLVKNIIEYYYKRIQPLEEKKKKGLKFVELKPERKNENV